MFLRALLSVYVLLALVPSSDGDIHETVFYRKIVIDPGHGGENLGALSETGVYEKDVNLAVAMKLKRYLERRANVQVFLTRDKDTDVRLEDRIDYANRTGADLFLSIHCNASLNQEAQGTETYVLSSMAAAEESARIERRIVERVGRLSAIEDEETAAVVKDLLLRSAHEQSRSVAVTLHNRLLKDCGMKDRGVKQLPIVVLRGAMMPAIVLELGFLSHPVEGKKLLDEKYQKSLAAALFWGILEDDNRMRGLSASRKPEEKRQTKAR